MESEQAILVEKKLLTEDLGIFRFQPLDSEVVDFKPGQFANLGLKLDEKGATMRAYSMASAPHEKKFYEFYIKHKEHPTLGKFTTALFKMNKDDVVFLQKPRGAFTIEEKKPNGKKEERRMILVATGTGLAPFMSYIRHFKKIGTKNKVILVHGVSYAAEFGYRDILEEYSSQKDNLDFTYIPTVSRPAHTLSKGWNGNIGRVESILDEIKNHNSKLEKILQTRVTPENSMFYLCGYKHMIDDVTSLLSPIGFVDNRHKRDDGSFDIKYELYGV